MNWLLFFKLHQIETLIFIFIFGSIVGSFLNVVIYRYPIMLKKEWHDQCLHQLNQSLPEKTELFNLCVPRSHCPECKKMIPGWHNIPIFSYIFLRGKCAFCHTKISPEYLCVELLTALLSVIVIIHFGITLKSILLLILTWGLIALSFIDLHHQILPDTITFSLLWLGLFISTESIFISSQSAIYGALIGYLFLWSIAKLYFIFRKKDGMGLGDCKMLAMFGAWVGALPLLNVILFSTGLTLIISLILIACKKMHKDNPIPFGPFIAIAGWSTIIYGPQLTQWLIR